MYIFIVVALREINIARYMYLHFSMQNTEKSSNLTLYSIGYFRSWHHFLFLDNKKSLSKVLNTFENIVENGAFASMVQMLHFPYWSKCSIFHNNLNYDISKASKCLIMV